MAKGYSGRRFKVRPYRLAVGFAVLLTLVLVPFFSQNPIESAPSRIVLGQLPPPTAIELSGDTWAFEVNGFKITHPMAFFEFWSSAKVIYLPLFASVLIPLFLTMGLGRVFCSWLCPVGFMLEVNMGLRKLLRRAGIGFDLSFPDLRYPLLALSLLMSFLLAAPLLSVIDPPHTLGRELISFFTHQSLTVGGISILLGIFIVDTFIQKRGCCSKLCPSGAGLEILGSFKVLKVSVIKERCDGCGKCDESCPYELKPMQMAAVGGNFNHTKCDNCGLCRDSCPCGAIFYTVGPKRDKCA